MDGVFWWISQYGYAGLFVLLLLGIVGLPIPDETLLVFCGYLVWKGHLRLPTAFLAGFGGSICGISLSYFLGRYLGRRLVAQFGRYIGLTEQRMARVHDWFERIGEWLLAIGYFIPGVRHFTAVVAGTSGLEFPKFALFAYSGAAVWVAVFLSLGYSMGERWQNSSAEVHRYALIVLAVLAAIASVAWLARRKRSG